MKSTAWPTVAHIAAHVTSIYTWVSVIIESGERVERVEVPLAKPALDLRRARDDLAERLQADDVDCWVLGGSTGTTAFWRRRMVLETMKHLLDVRTTPDDQFAVPRELDAELAVDGIDEFFAVFLAHSRSTLAPLPGGLRIIATDADRSWHITPDWHVDDGEQADSQVEATAAALLLLLWERADALEERDRFTVSGDESIVQALMTSPIHR
ncbi:MAG: hypothetical protein KIT89_13260 [Microcella sp.]|nr:MAG: hypothetical protein KIT89_13260 [Microcella sp.]